MIYGNIECVKLDGHIKAYVRIQNEWTGEVRGRLCTIHTDKDNKKWIRADTKKIYIDQEITQYLVHEQEIEKAIQFYKDNAWAH